MNGSLDMTEDRSELHTEAEIIRLYPQLCRKGLDGALVFPGEGKFFTKTQTYLVAHTTLTKPTSASSSGTVPAWAPRAPRRSSTRSRTPPRRTSTPAENMPL